MKTNTIIASAAMIFVLGGAVGWFGGTHYSNSKLPQRGDIAAMMRNGQGGGAVRQGVGNMVAGEIISKDATTITLKLTDGGSRIVFLSDTTDIEITKVASGSVSDLVAGVGVTVRGTQNDDGSVTAQSVQLRPAIPVTPGRSSDR
jgi:hypothetical protein